MFLFFYNNIAYFNQKWMPVKNKTWLATKGRTIRLKRGQCSLGRSNFFLWAAKGVKVFFSSKNYIAGPLKSNGASLSCQQYCSFFPVILQTYF